MKVEIGLPRKYASPDKAADMLDTYYANYDLRDQPQRRLWDLYQDVMQCGRALSLRLSQSRLRQ
jgi:hypothetical protein